MMHSIGRSARGLSWVAIAMTFGSVSGRADEGTSSGCDPAWVQVFGGVPEVEGTVCAFAFFDDGTGGGSQLHVAGTFSTAGGVPANHIAKWDGTRWQPLGEGLSLHGACALAVFDEGGGPALYVGGSFSHAGGQLASRIARWDGTRWSPVGGGMDRTVAALAVFDDGSGPALYAGGRMGFAGGLAVGNIARWDGTSWSSLGVGLDNTVNDLLVHDDGTGPALYATGGFRQAGGVAADHVARWDGTSWSALDVGLNRDGFALGSFDDGGGRELYVGGYFTQAGGNEASSVARWDGSTWSAVGSGLSGGIGFPPSLGVFALAEFDDGTGGGAALYAGGGFEAAGSTRVASLARWDGVSWAPVASTFGDATGRTVFALAPLETDPARPSLCVGGDFEVAGDGLGARGVALSSAAGWSALGSGLDDAVHALEVFDDGTASGLYAVGAFEVAGSVPTRGIARWDGTDWHSLGAGLDDSVPMLAHSLEVLAEGNGSALYVGGAHFSVAGLPPNGIARWDGTSWSAVGTGFQGSVDAMQSFDDGAGPALFVAGFIGLQGGPPIQGLTKWDGSTWSDVGAGVQGSILCMAVFDDGSGPALYAGGDFTAAGGSAAARIARWDGSVWSPLGAGLDDRVSALAVFDDGSGAGPALYAGGEFGMAGNVSAEGVARWNGSSWAPLGSGLAGRVRALAVHDDGSGPALYAGGDFTAAGGSAAARIARWDGAAWAPLGGGFDGTVRALAAFDDGRGGGPSLFAGGLFVRALDSGDALLARWGCSVDGPVIYCTAKPSSVGCTPSMAFDGVPSVSSPARFDLVGRDVVPAEPGQLLYAYGDAQLAFHGGVLCIKAPVVRSAVDFSEKRGGACSGWELLRNFNKRIQSGWDPRLTVGATVFAQWRQRDPADPAGFGDSLTDAIRFVVQP